MRSELQPGAAMRDAGSQKGAGRAPCRGGRPSGPTPGRRRRGWALECVGRDARAPIEDLGLSGFGRSYRVTAELSGRRRPEFSAINTGSSGMNRDKIELLVGGVAAYILSNAALCRRLDRKERS